MGTETSDETRAEIEGLHLDLNTALGMAQKFAGQLRVARQERLQFKREARQLRERLAEFEEAGRSVVDACEHGDLAGAVNDLQALLEG